MSDATIVALITTAGLVLCTLVGVWIELIRGRRRQTQVVTEVSPNGGTTMRDAVNRIDHAVQTITTDVGEIRSEQRLQRNELAGHGERLAAVEALTHTQNRTQRGR